VQTAEQPTESGTWTAAEQLSTPGHTASAPRLAVDVSGAAVAVWKSDSGFVQVVARSAATGAWTAPEDVGRAGVMAEPPQVALDGAANATVVYVAGTTVETAVRSSAIGEWRAPQALPSAGPSYPEFQQLALSVNAAGDAVAVWRRGSEDAPPPVVRASERMTTSGSWSEPQTLSSATAEAGLPQVALDAAGNAVAVWQDGIRTSPFVCPSAHCTFPTPDTEAAVRSRSSGTWSAPVRWTDAYESQLAVDPAGDALVVRVGPRRHRVVVQATDLARAAATWTVPNDISVPAVCAVPRLIGRTLSEAEGALKANGCRTGRITYAYSQTWKRGRVLAQRPKAKATLDERAPVNVVISRGRRRR
jgi:hypothetical protein